MSKFPVSLIPSSPHSFPRRTPSHKPYNHADIDPQPSSQLIPGHEGVGKIVAVGNNVKSLKVGDRCAADVCNSCADLGLPACYFCR